MFQIFLILQSDMVLRITNPFSWTVRAVAKGESCQTVIMAFLLENVYVRTEQFFPAHSDSWLGNSNFICQGATSISSRERLYLIPNYHCNVFVVVQCVESSATVLKVNCRFWSEPVQKTVNSRNVVFYVFLCQLIIMFFSLTLLNSLGLDCCITSWNTRLWLSA